MTDDSPHRLAVLLIPGFVEPGFLANIFLDCRWDSFFARVEIAGRQLDQNPRDRDDDQNGGDGDEKTSDYESEHSGQDRCRYLSRLLAQELFSS